MCLNELLASYLVRDRLAERRAAAAHAELIRATRAATPRRDEPRLTRLFAILVRVLVFRL